MVPEFSYRSYNFWEFGRVKDFLVSLLVIRSWTDVTPDKKQLFDLNEKPDIIDFYLVKRLPLNQLRIECQADLSSDQIPVFLEFFSAPIQIMHAAQTTSQQINGMGSLLWNNR